MAKLPKGAKLSAIRRAEREKRIKARERFKVAKSAHRAYARQLTSVAKQVGHIVEGLAPDIDKITRSLRSYAELIKPWAQSVAAKQIAEADQRDKRAWAGLAGEMGQVMRAEIPRTEFAELMAEQVDLITSLPLKAAQRVHHVVEQAMIEGRRADETAAEILKTGKVTKSRAMLIARTETSRAASVLTETRAKYVGSEGYVWRTSSDGDVRELHRELEGTFHRWDDPPVAGENGERAHPGGIYNCFTVDTRIDLRNGLRRIWRVPFNGKIIHLVVGGKLVKVTANHPILTTRGWTSAGLLNRGDNIIAMGKQQGQVVENDINNMNPTFGDVFESFAGSSSYAMNAAGLQFDFHGDVFDHDVDEVVIDLVLPNYGQIVGDEEIRQLLLAQSDPAIPIRKVLHVGDASFPRLRDVRTILLWSPLGHHQPISFELRSLSNPISLQNVGNSSDCASITGGNKWSAPPFSIEAQNILLGNIDAAVLVSGNPMGYYDASIPEVLAESIRIASNGGSGILEEMAFGYHCLRVEDVSLVDFSGHVFTLESDNGWYGVTDAGIISKNCRCYPEPVLPDIID